MGIFNRAPKLTPEELDELAASNERAANDYSHGPDASPYREIDANRMAKQAERLHRQADRARRRGDGQ